MKEKGGEESTFLYKSTPREAGMKSSSLTSSSMEISKFCLFNPRNKG
jgi:hypothetical protein